MVTTRRQQKQKGEDASAEKSQPAPAGSKQSHGTKITQEEPSSKKPRLEEIQGNNHDTDPQDKARCEANQPLVNALHRLSGAMFKAQKADDKNRYKGLAISRAAQAIARLDFQVTSGQKLGQPGPDKVTGIGKGTANYIDEFLESGELIEIEEYERMAHEAEDHDGSDEKRDGTNRNEVEKDTDETEEASKKHNSNHVIINRAPVLTLWVTVVAERQGFSHSEALSYGKFVSVVFAQSKGKALGLFHPKTKKGDAQEKTVDTGTTDKDERVHGFGRMKIPVQRKDGDRLAVLKGSAVNPVGVEDYLKRSFGDKLDVTRNAMQELAESFSVEDLEARAYKLYEKFRPPWKGWGRKSVLDLSKMHEMAKQT